MNWRGLFVAATHLEVFHVGNASFANARTLSLFSVFCFHHSSLADEIREFFVEDNSFSSVELPSFRDALKLQNFTLGQSAFKTSKTGIAFDGTGVVGT